MGRMGQEKCETLGEVFRFEADSANMNSRENWFAISHYHGKSAQLFLQRITVRRPKHIVLLNPIGSIVGKTSSKRSRIVQTRQKGLDRTARKRIVGKNNGALLSVCVSRVQVSSSEWSWLNSMNQLRRVIRVGREETRTKRRPNLRIIIQNGANLTTLI